MISDTEPIISDVTATSLMLSWQPAAATSFLLESVPVTYTLHYQVSLIDCWINYFLTFIIIVAFFSHI